MNTRPTSMILLTTLLVLAGAGCGLSSEERSAQLGTSVKDFAGCAAAGYQVSVFRPRTCLTPEGKIFAEPTIPKSRILPPEYSEKAALSVYDQLPDWFVFVSATKLERPGWVVIRTDEKGKPGKDIGHRLFGSGMQDGLIELKQGTKDGESFFAELRKDDGDASYNVEKDLPIKDAKGAVIRVKFKVDNFAPQPIQFDLGAL